MHGTSTPAQRRMYQHRYRERKRAEYHRIARAVCRRWFRSFWEQYREDASQECWRIALQYAKRFGPRKFRRIAAREIRLAAKGYGLFKSNGSPLHREFLSSEEVSHA
jgi:hypothetical protein